MASPFSLVTINEKSTPRIVENVRRYGLDGRLAAVQRMRVDRIADLGAAFTDKAARRNVIRQFLKAADANVELGAEVVIPAGGVAMALRADTGVYQAARGTPILNGVTALVKMGEMAVKLDRIMGGHFTSKRLQYAPPGTDEIEEMRRYYGDVYPAATAEQAQRRHE
jgi:allantoin racemase